ncbi:alpha/beta fold hydrolase [Phenylobacterium sp.]|uniref:alpha/beta fold hydrolase n=1 Tax=Phenylobacterium sp. TaxID=1871053 RepID=UPI002FCBFC4A
MNQPSIQLLSRLALARAIPFRTHRLPASGWLEASDGLRLHYLDWPGGPDTLVLLHGGALSAHTFDLLALALGDDVRCIALDLRGHGASGWADEYSVERWAADVRDLVRQFGVAAIHLAGMSLGGCVAGHAAAALGDRLASLTFIDVGDQVNFTASARMRAFIEGVRPVAQVEGLVRQALAVSPRTDPDLMLYRYQSLLTPGPDGFGWKADRRRPTNFPHILGKLAELADLAPRISCPVLVVKGGRSRVLSQAGLEQFAGRFPRGDWAVVPGAGHNVQEDQPAALAAELQLVITRAAHATLQRTADLP